MVPVLLTTAYLITNKENLEHSMLFGCLAERLRRWSNIVQMLYKCFVFTGLLILFYITDALHH